MSLETIRWGVIGAGNVFEYKSGPALYKTPHSELTAVMRTSIDKAHEVATRHGAKRWYTDAASLVNDPDVNAVYIASPHYLHPEHVALAARAKKIVLSEKPLGVTTTQAQACVDVCKKNGVPLTVAYYRRYWAITQAIKKFVHEGAIGRIVQARIGVSDWFSGDNERAWLLSREKSGGDALANVGAHWVDLVRYLLGEPREVVALCSSTASGFETDDTVGVDMRLDNDALVSLLVTRRTPVSTNEFDIFGTEGSIRVSSLVDGKLVLYRKGHDAEPMQFSRIGVMHSELVAALVPRMLRGEPSPLPGEEAVAVWRVMQAAYHSAEQGVRVKI
ncbi:MAG: Gfo/Idh/MocA family oxidoreductase [Chloroflexi bacterium]|nr:Gfo/Idh/MocA family oxidoreductase [Chloroflexota bacterium]